MLGAPGTSSLLLSALGNGSQIVIGGDTEGPGYTLTQDEASRIEGQGVSFFGVSGEGGGDNLAEIAVRDLLIDGEGDGGLNFVGLTSDGTVRVVADGLATATSNTPGSGRGRCTASPSRAASTCDAGLTSPPRRAVLSSKACSNCSSPTPARSISSPPR